jgi:hypothetical protein
MKKRIIFLATMACIIHSAYAQKAQLGFTVGSTLSDLRSKANDGTTESGKNKIGLAAGIITHIAAGKNFTVQTGVNWVQKVTRDENPDPGTDEKVSLTVNYFEIPVNFLYNNGSFFIGGGPSVAFAFDGKVKVKFNGETGSVKLSFGNSDNDDMRRIDLGGNIVAGYQFKNRIFVMANFNQGFSNLAPGNASNGKLRSHYFGLRLGYFIKGKK